MTEDANYWKEVALYLASVSGATARSLIAMKSTSQSERWRQVEICKAALDMIDGKMLRHPVSEKAVRGRLLSVISSASKTGGTK